MPEVQVHRSKNTKPNYFIHQEAQLWKSWQMKSFSSGHVRNFICVWKWRENICEFIFCREIIKSLKCIFLWSKCSELRHKYNAIVTTSQQGKKGFCRELDEWFPGVPTVWWQVTAPCQKSIRKIFTHSLLFLHFFSVQTKQFTYDMLISELYRCCSVFPLPPV